MRVHKKKKKAVVCIYIYKQNDTNIHIIKMPSNLKDKGQYIYHKVLISLYITSIVSQSVVLYTYVDVDVEVIR